VCMRNEYHDSSHSKPEPVSQKSRGCNSAMKMFWTPRVLSALHSLDDSASDLPSFTLLPDADYHIPTENNKDIRQI
jgi:hypothetical protein